MTFVVLTKLYTCSKMAGRATLETVEWIDYRDFSPEEFLEEANDFPQMVQISEGFYGDGEMWSFSSGQIFKIHGVKTQEKVVTTVEGGQDTPGSKVDKLHIPLNYGGHFELLPSEPCSEGVDVVYNSVKEVAKNFPRYVCVDSDMSVTSDLGGVRLHRGDQLELLQNAKRPTKNGLKPFLKCLVNSEKECFLPHGCRGRFLVIPDENSYTISEIVKRFPLPRRVQFYGGYINYCSPEVMQSLGYSFDGVLRLEGTTLEKYLVATTQGLSKKSENKKDLLVMPVKAKIKFLVAKGLFERSSEYETVLTAFSRDFDVDRMSEHPYMTFEFAPLTYPDEEEPPPPLSRGLSEEPPAPGAEETPPNVDRSSKPESLVRELSTPRASTSSQAETENYDYDSDGEDYETISDDDYDCVPDSIGPAGKGGTRPVVPPEEGEYELIDEDRDVSPDGAAAAASRQKTAQAKAQPQQNPFAAELKGLLAKRAQPTKTTPSSQDPNFSKGTPSEPSTTQAVRPTFGARGQLKSPTSKPATGLTSAEKVGPLTSSPKPRPAKPPVAPRRKISSSSDEPGQPTSPGQPHKADPVPTLPTKVTGLVSPLRAVKPVVTEDEDKNKGSEHISVIHSSQRETASRKREMFSSLSDVPTELSQLSIKQVSHCLQLLNMAEYVPRFERDQVDGNLMCDLDQEMLTEMGVSRVHSMKLKKFINGWRPNADN
ncbi:PREDICTED: uncharacterized protein LOC109476182 isoform X1 [Branchiostoma belcheri]|uniref:Uncharacterized protein LOC109476182 isoform X1 n=1 Tax=Branchiostoma belcheri TaxID=7741 RepID=A0A6P4ZSP2_BRABE|nr:PREDICTED: uncharacterized protein LOC109476182 isoform X1 [Branchiostoma belcheri]